MIYTMSSFWLAIIVLLAWGIHHVWCGIAQPRAVNAVLLPGTLVAQLGRIVGLLITGATVNKAALMKDDDTGEPATAPDTRPKIPVIGPVVVALLPMLALGGVIYLAIMKLGLPVVAKMPQGHVSPAWPETLAAFWDQLRGLITLAEGTLAAVRTAEAVHWRIALFVYLMICLTIRMAPLPGNVRGHLGAVVVLGIGCWLAGTLSDGMPEVINRAWPLVSLTVGWLLLLMMITLAVRGVLSGARMILNLDT